MKILGIIVHLLAIIMVAHAYDYIRTIRFKDNIIDCGTELNEPIILTKISGEMFVCALKKNGVFDRLGELTKQEMYNFLMDTIRDEDTAQASWELFEICYSNVNKWNYESIGKWTYVLNCSSPIIPRLMLQSV